MSCIQECMCKRERGRVCVMRWEVQHLQSWYICTACVCISSLSRAMHYSSLILMWCPSHRYLTLMEYSGYQPSNPDRTNVLCGFIPELGYIVQHFNVRVDVHILHWLLGRTLYLAPQVKWKRGLSNPNLPLTI